MKYTIVEVDKNSIVPGDTIMLKNGEMQTICCNNIKHDAFMGTTICGDSYKGGREKVKKVVIMRAMPNIQEGI